MFGSANGTSDMPSRHKPPAVPMGPGAWPTARPCSPHFRLLTSMLSVFLGCWTCSSSTELNRRMRTRMYGGVAGESGRPLPLCRFSRLLLLRRVFLDRLLHHVVELSRNLRCVVLFFDRYTAPDERVG